MELMRESWTDERLDDLEERMEERFNRVDRDMKAGFDRVDKDMKAGFDRVDADIRELRRMMILGVGIMVTGFFSLAGLMVL